MTAAALGGVVALVVLQIPWPAAPVAALPTLRRPARRAWWIALALPLLGLATVAPPLPLLALVSWFGWREARRRRARRERERAIRHALPDLVDLLRLATTAGLALPVAHPLVARHVPPPVGTALSAAHTAASRGRPRADALVESLAPFGERARALAHVLSDHLRYGVPLLPGLERNGLELRLDRRRAAELDARRVPVRLLGPLVTCVLPAFALLTVVPLIAASLDALPL
ncbi:MAG: hypothetical protein ACJ739_07475 [Acidimicrobiales bacterium]